MKKIIFLLTMLISTLTFAQPATGQNDPPPNDSADVVSLYNGITTPMGDEYTNEGGVVFDTFGSAVTIADLTLADGNTVKQYTNHNYSGIGSGSYDVGQMEMLHIDVYFENAAGDFRIKLEDTSAAATEISVDGAATTGTWLSYDIDLTLFSAPNLASLKWIVPVTTAANTNFYFDNIYFWKAPTAPGSDATLSDLQVDGTTIVGFSPSTMQYDFELMTGTTEVPQITTATSTDVNATSVTITQAPAIPGDATVVVVSENGTQTETYTVSFSTVGPPTGAPVPPARDAVDVISLFSDAYTDIVVDTFDTPWCPGTTTEVLVDSNPTKLVEGLGCEGVDFQSGRFDATEFTHFHMDIYTDSATMDKSFNVKLSNWNGGAGEANALEYSANNGNVLTNPNPGSWISLDIPLADFTSIVNADRNDIVQFIISSDLGTVYYDNLYFWKEPYVAGPATAAPLPPARNAEDVVSLFSDSYTNITVDTFDTPWCPGTTTEVLVDTNPTKLVEGLGCEGVDFQSSRFDATEFTHFHMDIFTETETLDKSFAVKLSNWNGGGGEANAIEYAVTNANFLTTPNPGTWISLDIPLDDFTAITNADRNDIVQFIISSDLGDVYYDNLYLWKGASISGPSAAAPTPPARNAEDVVSLFSDAYSDIVVDTFDTPWCPGTTTEVLIASNPTKLVEGLGCEGVDFQSSRFDATEFTHFHMDIYTESATMDKVFNVKFSNWNGGGGEANALEYSINNSNFLTNPNPGDWISLDIPLDDFTAITNADRNDIVQFVISSDLGEVYYDNLYLWKEGGAVTGPQIAAPTPPMRDAADVASIFSDAYTNIAVETFDTPWCPGTTTEVLIDSDPTKLVSGLGCEGVEFINDRIDATELTHFHMDIFTDADTMDKSFNVKFSNWDGGGGEANALEYSINNSNFLTNPNPGTWISLDIPLDDFAAVVNANRNDIAQFIISSDLGEVYYDNLYLWKEGVGGAIVELPITLEDNQLPVFSDFNGAFTQVIANPDVSGDNTSANVVENTVPAGAAFAGTNFPVDTDIDITSDKMFTMTVWSPLANTPVLLKLENGTTGVNAEREVSTTMANTWETITFDFSTEGALTFESVTVFMNFNMTDAADQIYYWDNLEQVVPVALPVELPITLEGGQLPVFGDFNGAFTQVIANPDVSGDNTSANVVENTVPAGAAFAGTNFPVDTDIDITTDKGFSMTVWSPLAGMPVLLKLENGTTGVNAEREVSTTMANTWETITFDFSTEGALTFESVTVFMNFNMTDAADQIYYWDNLEQVTISAGGSDATLSDLQVDGTTIAGFDPAIMQYNVDLPTGTTVIPQITLATPSDVDVTSVTITQAPVLPGDATVVVISENGTVTETYTVSFAIVLGSPMVAAPTPPARAPEDVISIFSDAYQDIIVDTYDTPWCPGTTTDILIDSNPTKIVTGLGCEGIEFITGRFDATDFTFLHIDIFTEVETLDKNFSMKLSNWNGGNEEANSIQYTIDNSNLLPSPNPGVWISLDIPLDDFSFNNNANRNDIVQFIISSNLGEVYYDNLYLHKNTTLANDSFNVAEFKVYPNPSTENWNISANSTINSIAIYDVLGSQVFASTPKQQTVTISAGAMSTGMYFARLESDKGVKIVKLIKK